MSHARPAGLHPALLSEVTPTGQGGGHGNDPPPCSLPTPGYAVAVEAAAAAARVVLMITLDDVASGEDGEGGQRGAGHAPTARDAQTSLHPQPLAPHCRPRPKTSKPLSTRAWEWVRGRVGAVGAHGTPVPLTLPTTPPPLPSARRDLDAVLTEFADAGAATAAAADGDKRAAAVVAAAIVAAASRVRREP